MSASERAAKRQAREEQRLINDAIEAARALMEVPHGHALVWTLLRDNLRAEGPGAKGRRQLAWDILDTMMVANKEGALTMLARHYWIRAGVRVDEDEPEPVEGEEAETA